LTGLHSHLRNPDEAIRRQTRMLVIAKQTPIKVKMSRRDQLVWAGLPRMEDWPSRTEGMDTDSIHGMNQSTSTPIIDVMTFAR
jgi:hypothetical protein